MISTMLAELLDVRPGRHASRSRCSKAPPGARGAGRRTLFETYIGTPAYMEIGALNRLMREPPSVTAVHLRVDPAQRRPSCSAS